MKAMGQKRNTAVKKSQMMSTYYMVALYNLTKYLYIKYNLDGLKTARLKILQQEKLEISE